ncbi:MAG: ferrous iron transport protein B [Phycisphaerae bacterium]
MKKITIALAGNPNCGKSCLFNSLTGARQHVGNYPGVTVEKVEGECNFGDYKINIVDLPGTYSLSAHSEDERVARDFILGSECDVVVNVLDSGNFERNMYLSTQLYELNLPTVTVLNMYDVAERQGIVFDKDKIGTFLSSAVVATVAPKGTGVSEVLAAAISEYEAKKSYDNRINYGVDIERHIESVSAALAARGQSNRVLARYEAIGLLQMDRPAAQYGSEVEDAVAAGIGELKRLYGDNPHILMSEKRYGFISGVFEQSVKMTVERRHDISDSIDRVLLSRVFGLAIFFVMMFVVFWLTFTIGEPFMNWIEKGFELLADAISGLWPEGSDSALRSLIVDGVIGGVGGVVVFLPNIIFLFIAIALLEDSGYMARAAFLMDRIMKKIGLHGQSFIPMLIGFGCTVPAIMGTRILNEKKSRLTTIMVLPLISCGARLPIYALIIPAFFPHAMHGLMMWLMYMIGITLAIALAWLLRKTLFKGENSVMLMELPPYRVPTMRSVTTHMWQKSWLYLKKAGTVILAISIVLWAMTTYPKTPAEQLEGLNAEQASSAELQNTSAGKIGLWMEPAISKMGFDYRIGTALIGAFAAKEVFVAQLGIVYSLGDVDEESQTLRSKLSENYTPLQGFCIMLFCLIATPCVATFAICKKETGSWLFAAGQFFGLTVLAYIITTVVYQTGMLFA